ncbi:LysR family transcriptional regulator [Streptomyces abyssalis]|uniref:LysR family transcriptional regulator n=1 Tax=Streptomyces abyssalis TaxID=933944 RepID=A0A1E7JTC3_9ACTN|nr:LysR family transcriptional regulator [Streptomyces abyssalis]OEU92149.1 LysR family transcriptional regulator [Streptomyces abyssalis]OEU94570.1 LysR family transcriptional regulator [Streptomyces abyssalis]
MELRHLEYFVTVAEERHFTRAAERLLVSQSGLSASVRALERELGAKLFVRTTRSVELTGPGRALLAEATRTLASVRAAKEAVAAAQGLLRGTLAVGTEQCIAGVDVPRLLARFRAEHPRVEVRLRQAGSGLLAEAVGTGRLDLAFIALCGPPPHGVSLTPLTEEPLVLLCHPGHALAGGEGARWAELKGEALVDFQPDWGVRQLTDRAFAGAGVERQVALEVNDVHSLLELVEQGLGVAVVPRHFARKPQAAGLCALPLTEGPQPLWEVSVARPAGDAASPASRKLCALLDLPDGGSEAPA